MVLFSVDIASLDETARTAAAILLPAQGQNQHMKENVSTAKRMANKGTCAPDRPHEEPLPSELLVR